MTATTLAPTSSRRRTRRRTNAAALVALVLLAVVVLVPVYYLIVTTFKTTDEAALDPMGLPSTFDLSVYVDAFVAMEYPRAFSNTFLITLGSVAGVVLLGSMA